MKRKLIKKWRNTKAKWRRMLFRIGAKVAFAEMVVISIGLILSRSSVEVPWFKIGWELLHRTTDQAILMKGRKIAAIGLRAGYLYGLYLEAHLALMQAGWDTAVVKRARLKMAAEKEARLC